VNRGDEGHAEACGPAFPWPGIPTSDDVPAKYGGLTKRELFAGLAVQAIVNGTAGAARHEFAEAAARRDVTVEAYVARMACQFADALLVELAK
jgi:hypothetical protein